MESEETPAVDTEDKSESVDEDEGIVEDVVDEEEEAKEEPVPEPPQTKTVVIQEWKQLNAQAPLWAR